MTANLWDEKKKGNCVRDLFAIGLLNDAEHSESCFVSSTGL